MARPIKTNADYFPHDTDMRNDPRIKAIRRKFGVEGYGIYCMTIEYIGHASDFRVIIDEIGIELMAGDFDVEPGRLLEVLKYCNSIDLLQINDGEVLTCKTLENRLSGLLSKRERDRGELSTSETPQNGVIASESTQSKVKYSKVEESKEEHICAVAENSLDEIFMETINQQVYPGVDLKLQRAQFLEKVRVSPKDYFSHDTSAFRKAFAYQLRTAKSTQTKQSSTDFLKQAIK